jgi:apolipoprotein N-acyltransferase
MMKLNRERVFYRLQQLFILIAHLLLLWWMLYTLREGGLLPVELVLAHFVGMSLYGALLIRGTAWWARHHFVQEVRKSRNKKRHS